MISKEEVYRQCVQIIGNKISLLQDRLNELKESVSNETKSTAGDKHETARAHLQLEQEQINNQLLTVLAQKSALEQIDIKQSAAAIIKGSLVKTDLGYLFISVAAGKIIVDAEPVIALSPQSPLGEQLMGLKVGARTTMNGKTYQVERID